MQISNFAYFFYFKVQHGRSLKILKSGKMDFLTVLREGHHCIEVKDLKHLFFEEIDSSKRQFLPIFRLFYRECQVIIDHIFRTRQVDYFKLIELVNISKLQHLIQLKQKKETRFYKKNSLILVVFGCFFVYPSKFGYYQKPS